MVDLHVGFSRHGKTKTYVQDLLMEQKDKVWDLIRSGAKIYVCGDGARMEPDVRDTIMKIYREKQEASEAVASTWLNELIDKERYVLDVWVG